MNQRNLIPVSSSLLILLTVAFAISFSGCGKKANAPQAYSDAPDVLAEPQANWLVGNWSGSAKAAAGAAMSDGDNLSANPVVMPADPTQRAQAGLGNQAYQITIAANEQFSTKEVVQINPENFPDLVGVAGTCNYNALGTVHVRDSSTTEQTGFSKRGKQMPGLVIEKVVTHFYLINDVSNATDCLAYITYINQSLPRKETQWVKGVDQVTFVDTDSGVQFSKTE